MNEKSGIQYTTFVFIAISIFILILALSAHQTTENIIKQLKNEIEQNKINQLKNQTKLENIETTYTGLLTYERTKLQEKQEHIKILQDAYLGCYWSYQCQKDPQYCLNEKQWGPEYQQNQQNRCENLEWNKYIIEQGDKTRKEINSTIAPI